MDIKTEYEADIGPTEFVFETVDIPTSSKKIAIWSNSETRQLFDFLKCFINEVGPKKRFQHKKDMWKEISLQIPGKTPKQCEERYKTVLRRKKKGKEKVYLTETGRKMVDLEPDENCIENTFEIVRKQQIDYETDDNVTPFKHVHVWTNNETKQLMSLRKTLIWEVGKRFTFQKQMWAYIASHFPGKTANQCEQRYKTVLKRKKRGFITKARRKTVDYKTRDCVQKVSKNNGAYNTESDQITNNAEMKLVTLHEEEATTTQVEKEPSPCKEPITQDNKEPANQEKQELTLYNILLEISAKKEEAKERRHRERMEATRQLQNILQQILNSKNI